MNSQTISNRSWAILIARLILGLIFMMAGIWKVFSFGPLEHAQNLFVEPYSDTFLPTWLLWFLGVIIPYAEMLAGALLVLGFRKRIAMIALGTVLVLVTFGHLMIDPLYEFHTHVFPRTILLLFLLIMPAEEDYLSVDGWLTRNSVTE